MIDHGGIKTKLYETIFGTETPAGRSFDIALIVAILVSVGIILLDSVPRYNARYGDLFFQLELCFTAVFTIEYLLRLYCSPNVKGYATSFFGVVDILSILPTFVAFIFPGASSLLVIRLIRILRIFRVLRLFRYLSEANVLTRSLLQSRRKIFIFLFMMLILSTVFGCLMYLIEGPENGFSSIPRSIYWAIVTITTVGYGDIVPHTVIGKALASLVMITGYAIIAVPTGIVTAELANELNRERSSRNCKNCERTGHDANAVYCKHCGSPM
ncbi:MAG: voltage-gated potassium channel [Halieaceae bacterium]